MSAISSLAGAIRRQPLLRKAAHASIRLIPDRPWTVRVPELGPLRIRLRRHRWFLWEPFGPHEEPVLAAFDRLIRDGDCVWDIGANIGFYARVMRQWFGAGPMVAIEPMQENFELLEANIALGRMEQVTALRMAASDAPGEAALQVDDVTSGTAVLDSISGGLASEGRRSAGLPPRTERVRTVRLDDLLAERALPAPAMMKIDTEGAEVAVLEGARELIRRHRPRLSIALHGVDKARGTLRVLAELGHVAAGEVRDGTGPTRIWRTLSPDDAPRLGNNNILAVGPDEAELLATNPGSRRPGPRQRR